jgi:hypothetical protein
MCRAVIVEDEPLAAPLCFYRPRTRTRPRSLTVDRPKAGAFAYASGVRRPGDIITSLTVAGQEAHGKTVR